MSKKSGEWYAEVAAQVAREVPAYGAFLKKHGVRSDAAFAELPLTTKTHYVHAYPKTDLLRKGETPLMVYASSGSTGAPTHWFSNAYTEERGGRVHERIFYDGYGFKKSDRVLVIVCFSMGLWVAGVYTMLAAREVAKRGYKISVVAPGLEKENIMGVFEHVAPLYDAVVLAGYPPFLTDIFLELKKRRIPLPKRLKVLAGGDKFTEVWRTAVMRMIGTERAADVVNVYGTAETAVLGYETPVSIWLRREAEKDTAFRKALFGEGAFLGGLFQFDARETHFETVGEELVLTLDAATPLIRYNIHDVGSVVTRDQMITLLKAHGKLGAARAVGLATFTEPFVLVKARTDVAVTYYAISLYPEYFYASVSDKEIVAHVTGSYVVYTKEHGARVREGLHLEIELAEGVAPTAALLQAAQAVTARTLTALSSEFAKLRKDLGDRVLPEVVLRPFGTLPLKKRGVKTVAAIQGKKPKVIIR